MHRRLLGIILATAVIAVSCKPGGVGKSDINKVWDTYIELKMATMKSGDGKDDNTLQDEAARKQGFADWATFREKAIRDLGPDRWNDLSRNKSMEFARAVGRIMKETAPAQKAAP